MKQLTPISTRFSRWPVLVAIFAAVLLVGCTEEVKEVPCKSNLLSGCVEPNSYRHNFSLKMYPYRMDNFGAVPAHAHKLPKRFEVPTNVYEIKGSRTAQEMANAHEISRLRREGRPPSDYRHLVSKKKPYYSWKKDGLMVHAHEWRYSDRFSGKNFKLGEHKLNLIMAVTFDQLKHYDLIYHLNQFRKANNLDLGIYVMYAGPLLFGKEGKEKNPRNTIVMPVTTYDRGRNKVDFHPCGRDYHRCAEGFYSAFRGLQHAGEMYGWMGKHLYHTHRTEQGLIDQSKDKFVGISFPMAFFVEKDKTIHNVFKSRYSVSKDMSSSDEEYGAHMEPYLLNELIDYFELDHDKVVFPEDFTTTVMYSRLPERDAGFDFTGGGKSHYTTLLGHYTYPQ